MVTRWSLNQYIPYHLVVLYDLQFSTNLKVIKNNKMIWNGSPCRTSSGNSLASQRVYCIGTGNEDPMSEGEQAIDVYGSLPVRV